MPDGVGRYRRPFACAAVLGFVAVLIVSVHRQTAPSRHYAQVAAGSVNSITWAVTTPGNSSATAQATPAALHGTFWVGLISLASGVAVVQWAGRLRIVRVGGRCGH
jgi:hypothetical protein